MSGYLDHVLLTFKQHNHPFVLIGVYARIWNGVHSLCWDTIDILVVNQKMASIAESLVTTGNWSFSTTSTGCLVHGQTNICSCGELRLQHTGDGLGPHQRLKYLHFYTEDLYKLSVQSCLELEVPDLCNRLAMTFEEEYIRDPHRRFGPMTWEVVKADKNEDHILFEIQARSPGNTFPIHVPSISSHLNAILQQLEHTSTICFAYGRCAVDHLHAFIRDHYLDWAPTARWLLDFKIAASNRERMEEYIKDHDRDPNTYDFKQDEANLPWKLTIPSEGEGSLCDERCGMCKEARARKEKEKQKALEERRRQEALEEEERKQMNVSQEVYRERKRRRQMLAEELARDFELPITE